MSRYDFIGPKPAPEPEPLQKEVEFDENIKSLNKTWKEPETLIAPLQMQTDINPTLILPDNPTDATIIWRGIRYQVAGVQVVFNPETGGGITINGHGAMPQRPIPPPIRYINE